MATLDYKMLARAQYDPLTENAQYRQEKSRLRKALADQYAAQFAKPGSIADRNDPSRWGSLESQAYPGLFNPYTRPGLARSNPGLAPDTGTTNATGMRRRKASESYDFSLDDLSDDEFLQSLGLDLGGLRRGRGVL